MSGTTNVYQHGVMVLVEPASPPALVYQEGTMVLLRLTPTPPTTRVYQTGVMVLRTKLDYIAPSSQGPSAQFLMSM